MADFSGAFREALETGDAARCGKLWAAAYPQMPQPKDIGEATVVMHRARTEAKSVTLAKRRYSHEWLIERGLSSALPDELVPPTIVEAVGISVNARSPASQELATALGDAMREAAANAMDEGLPAAKVKALMNEARERVFKQ